LRTSRFAILVILIVVMLVFVYKLNDYRAYRNQIPQEVSLAGIPMGGKWEAEAMELLAEAVSQPVKLNYLNQSLLLHPQDVGFQLKANEMLEEVNKLKAETSFWQGFADYLLSADPQPVDIPLQASYDEQQLKDFLATIADEYDRPLQEPNANANTLTFVPGHPEQRLDIAASLPLVVGALNSATVREVDLVVR